ncbi:NADH-dependent dehydrogenase [Armatimonadota bacterium]|nr:NADH-dependent dehydrogenase [Armatimonadota bacterium]
MSQPSLFTRRNAIQNALFSSLIPALVSSKALGNSQRQAVSNRVSIALIGAGGMGNAHLDKLLGRRDVDVLAVCDVYEPYRNKTKKRIGEQCAAYNDYRYILDRKDIDAVLIATPDHWHALITKNAAEAGKDIYCEKPFIHSIGEGRPVINAVRRYGRICQVGSQQRSDAKFRYACELVRSGKIGKVHTVHTGFSGAPKGGDTRVTSPPLGLDWKMYSGPAPLTPFQTDRFGFNFRWFYDYSGGMMTDWGAHHNDIAQWGLGMDETGPVEIEGFATFPTEGAFDTATSFEILYTYANGVRLRCSSLQRGVRFVGTNGWIFVDRGVLEASSPDILEIQLGANDVHLYESAEHHENWLNSIRTRQLPICDAETGFRSVTVCHLGNIAIRLGRKLNWNPQTERFVGDEEANRWLFRPYRAPWHL